MRKNDNAGDNTVVLQVYTAPSHNALYTHVTYIRRPKGDYVTLLVYGI